MKQKRSGCKKRSEGYAKAPAQKASSNLTVPYILSRIWCDRADFIKTFDTAVLDMGAQA